MVGVDCGNANSADSGGVWTIRPQRGTGWEMVIDGMERRIVMRLRLIHVELPVSRNIPYSQIVRIATVCRESWWSRALTPISGSFGRGVISGASRAERTVMPSKGWRYDVLMTLEGGKTIKIKTVHSPDAAAAMEQRLRRAIGLCAEY